MTPLLRTNARAELDEVIVGVDDGAFEWLCRPAVVDAFVESDPPAAILRRFTNCWPRHPNRHVHHGRRREWIVQRQGEGN